MKIAILGSGDVGQVLGAGLAHLGHQVMMGSRNPSQDKIRKWAERAGANATAGSFAEATQFGEMGVLATLWAGTQEAIQKAGPTHLAGKLVIDATNPLDFTAGMPPKLAVGHTNSGGEQVQRWLPDSHVVKAFNTIGNPHMVHPDFPGGPPDMFICGNNAEAKHTTTELLKALGWSVIDMGGIESSRYLEPLAMLWMQYYFQNKTGDHAFKLLRK